MPVRDGATIAVYITASAKHGTLYVGVTSDLWLRMWRHKQGVYEGFSKKHGCTGLVWFETFPYLAPAFLRETRIKGWRRRWKIDLIEKDNSAWRDLAADWVDETTNRWLLDPDNP